MSWIESLKSVLKPLVAPQDLPQDRYLRLQQMMEQKSIEHYLIEDPLDVFYLTGYYFSSASFLAHIDSKADLIVDSRYYNALGSGYWKAHLLDRGFWQRFWPRSGIKSLAFDPDKTTYTRYQELCDQCVEQSIRLDPQKSVISRLQRVKDSSQLQKMEAAGKLACSALEHVCQILEEGISEKQVAKAIRLYFIQAGADIAFEPIVAFGPNSATPHHSCTDRALKQGDMVLIDLGAKLEHYCSDMTRSFFFGKSENPELSHLWNVAKEAFDLAKSSLKAGVTSSFLDRSVRDHLRKLGLEDKFTHSLGHGIGLRVHESPRLRSDSTSDSTLEPGTVITIEPGLYLPGVGGIRIEDTLVATPEGYHCLTPFVIQSHLIR